MSTPTTNTAEDEAQQFEHFRTRFMTAGARSRPSILQFQTDNRDDWVKLPRAKRQEIIESWQWVSMPVEGWLPPVQPRSHDF